MMSRIPAHLAERVKQALAEELDLLPIVVIVCDPDVGKFACCSNIDNPAILELLHAVSESLNASKLD